MRREFCKPNSARNPMPALPIDEEVGLRAVRFLRPSAVPGPR
jgi:hypothetical protein